MCGSRAHDPLVMSEPVNFLFAWRAHVDFSPSHLCIRTIIPRSSQPPAYQRYASLAATGNASLPNQSKAAEQTELDNDVIPAKPALKTLSTLSGGLTGVEKPDLQQQGRQQEPVIRPRSPQRVSAASSQLRALRPSTVESPTKNR